MADRLFNILSFSGISIGGTQTLAHGIQLNGVSYEPDVVWLQYQDTFEFVSATTTALTIRNTANAGGACQAFVMAIAPVIRMLGVPHGDGNMADHLTPQPFVPGSPNAGGGGAGVVIQDEGAPIANNPHGTLNFTGAGVTATDVAGVATINVPGATAALTVSAVLTSGTVLGAAHQLVRVNPTGGGFTVTLPAAAGAAGDVIFFKNVSNSANTVVVAAGGGDTIDGAATVSLSGARFHWQAISDGVSQWLVTG